MRADLDKMYHFVSVDVRGSANLKINVIEEGLQKEPKILEFPLLSGIISKSISIKQWS